MSTKMESAQGFSPRMHIDIPLLSGLVALSGIGLLVLYSASGQDVQIVLRQGVRLAIAFGVMVLLAQVAPRHLFRWAPWLYVIGLALLVSVLMVGDVTQGPSAGSASDRSTFSRPRW